MQQSVKKILVYGAGAIGSVLIARLTMAGHQVSVIARGETFNVISQDGIHLEDLTGHHHVQPYRVVRDVTELEAQDYIFIATKFHALSEIAPQLATLLHDDTVVIPLMNGIPFWYFYGIEHSGAQSHINTLDPDGQLSKTFPLKHLIGAVVFITAQLIQPGKVKSINPYLLIFGEPSHQMSERLKQLVELFTNTNIEARPVEAIRDQIWTKVMANLSSNPLSVVANTSLDQIYSHPHLHPISRAITQEVRQVAACYGARISIDPTTFLKLGAEMGPTYTSMWYDYQKKHRLELESIADAVFELAEAYNCEMPMTRCIYGLTKFLSTQSLKQEGAAS
ncbi:ketopantoate reductase PanE/ApbA (plasmid) [Acinetobacter sp. NCu2D-2]|uniref:ketopantoate reductase family protein n=1 Tax=Acinetobacter sp. NCu2D-2 TaxID=1608473 RepID=UPI0007CE0C52|nr:2-dehydropantoate 2-reductase [Acinetobacter sp. NCu2D-2]ANF83459.1 ketopantoate reductase PanE/ApbA [Acinetobacter sp. NCu2D-2]